MFKLEETEVVKRELAFKSFVDAIDFSKYQLSNVNAVDGCEHDTLRLLPLRPHAGTQPIWPTCTKNWKWIRKKFRLEFRVLRFMMLFQKMT